MSDVMKKGDLVQKSRAVPAGERLMHGFASMERAEQALRTIRDHYNVPESAVFEVGSDDLNPGKLAVLASVPTAITVEAKVNWVVDHEVSITYTDTGGSEIIDLNEEREWVVIESAVPSYQSDVEHLSIEELRASIEGLRVARMAKPAPVRAARVAKPKAAPLSAQDKALNKVLGGMSADAKLALQRKLGLVD